MACQKGLKPELVTGKQTKISKSVKEKFAIKRKDYLGPRKPQ